MDSAINASTKLYFAGEYAANILDPHFLSFPLPVVVDKVQIRKCLEEKVAVGEIACTALSGGPIFDMCKPPRTAESMAVCSSKSGIPTQIDMQGSTRASWGLIFEPVKPRFTGMAILSRG